MVAVVRIPKLMCGAVDVQPVGGQALQPRHLVAHFIIQDLGSAPRNGVKPGIAQPCNGVTHAQIAVFGDGENFRSGVAVQVNLGKALLDPAHHLLMPFDLQVRMQASLHQHARAAHGHRFRESSGKWFRNRGCSLPAASLPFRGR